MSISSEREAPSHSKLSTPPKKERTLKRAVSTAGIGVFSGQQATIRLCPQESGGIVFKRVDLAGQPKLPARLEYVKATPRCTILGDANLSVQTVEHLLAALHAYEIDHLLIEISGPEVPIFDGSALHFVELIENAGLCELQQQRECIALQTPVFWSEKDIHIVALPSDTLRISYTLHYPHSAVIGAQYGSFVLSPERFKKEIAPSRTFSIYEEIAPMIEKGLVKGGTLQSAVVIKEGRIFNPEGLRYPDEMVRHKILDLIGDLSLIPLAFSAHIIALLAGHSSNNAFANKLYDQLKMECS